MKITSAVQVRSHALSPWFGTSSLLLAASVQRLASDQIE
jgi:uncharacterized membrane protein (DUF4010 family)